MEIETESFKRVDLITVTGRIDGSNANELEATFKGLADDGRYRLVIDLSGIDYMASAGLRALVSSLRENKKHHGDLRIANPSKRMEEVLNLAGLNTIFSVYDDPVSAVGSY